MHMHRRIIKSHKMVTAIKKKLTRSEVGKKLAFPQDRTSKMTVCICLLRWTQVPSASLRLNRISIWSLAAGYMQGYKRTGSPELTGSTGFVLSNVDESGSAAASSLCMLEFDSGFIEPSLI